MTGNAHPADRGQTRVPASDGGDTTVERPSPAAAGGQGVHCRACGSTLWPAQQYGCERCGADSTDLHLVDLAGTGRLLSFATVYSHPDLPTPYTVVEVALDSGQLIRGVWAEPASPGHPAVGIRVLATGTGAGDRTAFRLDEPLR